MLPYIRLFGKQTILEAVFAGSEKDATGKPVWQGAAGGL